MTKKKAWWEKAQRVKCDPRNGVYTVTPEIARELIERGLPNRDKKLGVVKRYAASLRAGTWIFTGLPMLFDKDGRMMDGLQRCSSIIEADCAMQVYCVFGIEYKTAMPYIDQPARRKLEDVLKMEGFNGAARDVSAVVRRAWQWRRGWQFMLNNAGLSNAEGRDFALKHRAALEEAVDKDVAPKVEGIKTPGRSGLHWLVFETRGKGCSQRARTFARRAATGQAGNGVDAQTIANYRQVVEEQRKEPGKLAMALAAAWNAYRLNKPISVRAIKDSDEEPHLA